MNNSAEHPAAIELLIRNWQSFAPLTEGQCRNLRRLPLRVREYRRGGTIATLGRETLESNFVISGSTFRYKLLPDGARQIMAMHFPGDFSDLDGFVLEASGHIIAAADHSVVASVPHTAIAEMLTSQPDLARWLIWELARNAATSREWLTAMGRQSAYQRIAHLLCELYFRMKWAGQLHDQTLEIELYQADLGDICGISTVHVNRSLKSLRMDGLVVLQGHHISIRDIDALADVAAFDPSYLYPLVSDRPGHIRPSPGDGEVQSRDSRSAT